MVCFSQLVGSFASVSRNSNRVVHRLFGEFLCVDREFTLVPGDRRQGSSSRTASQRTFSFPRPMFRQASNNVATGSEPMTWHSCELTKKETLLSAARGATLGPATAILRTGA